MICKKLRIKDLFKEDFGTRITRIDPDVILENNFNSGDTICIYNDSMKKSTGAIAFPSDKRDKGTNFIRIDAILRRNDNVRFENTRSYLAQQVSFAGFNQGIIVKNAEVLTEKLKNCLVSKGDIFSFRAGAKIDLIIVINHTPQTEVVKIHENTSIFFQEKAY